MTGSQQIFFWAKSSSGELAAGNLNNQQAMT
jgi:hypothetical protein